MFSEERLRAVKVSEAVYFSRAWKLNSPSSLSQFSSSQVSVCVQTAARNKRKATRTLNFFIAYRSASGSSKTQNKYAPVQASALVKDLRFFPRSKGAGKTASWSSGRRKLKNDAAAGPFFARTKLTTQLRLRFNYFLAARARRISECVPAAAFLAGHRR